jgi:hypothetical protein
VPGRLLLGIVVLVAAFVLAGCGGGGGSDDSATETTTDSTDSEALPGIPSEFDGYRGWTKLNADPIPPRDSDPHFGTKDVYASATAEGGVYPDGAIVVKEAVRPDADFVGLIATMRKEAGANPEHNDWVFVEWSRDAADAEFTELASGGICTSCHVGARDTDYVFTPDESSG